MQAIEFQTVAHNRYIRVPDEIPDGMEMRVLFLIDKLETLNQANENQWKELLFSMPDVGLDEDFVRCQDYGREMSWDI
jgi:hypothetical protein